MRVTIMRLIWLSSASNRRNRRRSSRSEWRETRTGDRPEQLPGQHWLGEVARDAERPATRRVATSADGREQDDRRGKLPVALDLLGQRHPIHSGQVGNK